MIVFRKIKTTNTLLLVDRYVDYICNDPNIFQALDIMKLVINKCPASDAKRLLGVFNHFDIDLENNLPESYEKLVNKMNQTFISSPGQWA